MKESEAKKVLRVLKEIGLLSQKDEPIDLNLNLGEDVSGISLSEFKKFETEKDTNLSLEKIYEIYLSIAFLHKHDSNQFESILYKLRAIKYDPANLELRVGYLKDFRNLVLDHIQYCNKDDFNSIEKEISRFKKFSEIKWGLNNKISNKCNELLYELEDSRIQVGTKKNDNWDNFINEWININRRFRPDEQALDYASQIILEQLSY